MNIFELARNLESQAEVTYRKLAEVANTDGLKAIFIRLANDENRHIDFINKMEKKEKVEVLSSDILSHAQEAISKMKSGKEKFTSATFQIDIYRAAQAQEAEAEKFYRDYAERSMDEQQRKIFFALAMEEHKHYRVLENIIDFINYPATHPENAEFNYREE